MTHRREFMKLPQLEEFRLRREQHTVELRKNQRTDEALKRRVESQGTEAWRHAVGNLAPSTKSTLEETVRGIKECLINAPGLAELKQSVQALRLTLSNATMAPIKEVVEAGFVPILVKVLDLSQFPEEVAVQFN